MRLPRMNDQTKIIVCTAVALVGVDLAVRALMMPRTVHVQTSDVVTAREFKLVDENGNLRALWKDSAGQQVGLQFRGDGWVQYVVFIRTVPEGALETSVGRIQAGAWTAVDASVFLSLTERRRAATCATSRARTAPT